MWGLNLYDGLAYLLSSLESMCSTREIIIVLHLVPSDSFEGVHLDRIITSYPCMTSHMSDLMHRQPGVRAWIPPEIQFIEVQAHS
jgi:hypothetical protein